MPTFLHEKFTMSKIEHKYCLISTLYLVGLFDIFILLHIGHNCGCFGDFLLNEDIL